MCEKKKNPCTPLFETFMPCSIRDISRFIVTNCLNFLFFKLDISRSPNKFGSKKLLFSLDSVSSSSPSSVLVCIISSQMPRVSCGDKLALMGQF